MELLERENDLADLAAWLRSATQHGGSIALVAGEAGIGKTALLREFSARHRDRHILWGACDVMITPRALAPLHDIARQTRGGLLAAMARGASRDTIFTAALDELDRNAETLVVLEDMHWADESTLDLLRFLGRRIHLTHALLVVTYRDDETGPRHPLRVAIGDLPRASTRAMSLQPLSECAVARLAGLYGRSATDLHALTGGNPFLLTEILAANAGTVPQSVRDAMLARVLRLSPTARDLAEFVSVVPERAEPWLIRGVESVNETDVEGCLGIGMLRDEDGALAFRHELARRSLEASLSPTRRRNLHGRALAMLISRPGVATARLARHAEGASNAEAVQQFAPAAAAAAASRGAHREAVLHYELALRHASNLSSPELARLHARLSHECALTGQHTRAFEAGRCALASWHASTDRIREGEALQWLSRLSRCAGDLAAARQFDVAAVEMLEALPPGSELSVAYSHRAQIDVETCALGSALDWSRRAVELAESVGCRLALAHALRTHGTVRITFGDDTGWGDLARSLELAQSGAHREEIALAYSGLAAMMVTRRRYDAAWRPLNDGLAYCSEQGFDSMWLDLVTWRARLRFEQGDWSGASEDAETVLRSPCAAAPTLAAALRTVGHIRVRRGDREYAVPLDQACSLGGPTGLPLAIAALAAIRAEAAWLAGDREGAVRAAGAACGMLRTVHDPRLKGELAVLLWRAGTLPEPPTDIDEPYALEMAGDWRGAARLWGALGCPYEQASTLAWYGAEPEQRAALTMLDRMAAAPAARALRRRMRAHAVRGVPRGSRPSTRLHPLGLTRRQAQILALLSEGLRNSAIAKRLFVSTKTVDHHVSAILAKLGVPTRTQAVARVHGELSPRG